MKKTSLEKRIKRRIIARKHKFFAICSPGLEKLCLREMECLPIKFEIISIEDGGVAFTGSVSDCYYANLFLRSPSRILMRIADFKAENFRSFEKKFNNIPWELFLKRENGIRFEVSTHHSRLYHSNAIAERAEKAIVNYFGGYCGEHDARNVFANDYVKAERKSGYQRIFIRAKDNHFVISLDSSGDLLHRRGIKTCVGKAPIRENLGFALLDSAGYSRRKPLIDPMCSSGTFSIEAAMILRNIPPGFFRNFAFQDWPCFSRPAWEYLKKQVKSQFMPSLPSPRIFSSDIDSVSIHNLWKTVEDYGFTSDIKVFKKDFFDIVPNELTDDKGVVILNPPYGKRLGKEKNTYSFFSEIGSKLKKDFKGWNLCILMPKKDFVHTMPFPVAIDPFFHGGLELFAATCKIP